MPYTQKLKTRNYFHTQSYMFQYFVLRQSTRKNINHGPLLGVGSWPEGLESVHVFNMTHDWKCGTWQEKLEIMLRNPTATWDAGLLIELINGWMSETLLANRLESKQKQTMVFQMCFSKLCERHLGVICLGIIFSESPRIRSLVWPPWKNGWAQYLQTQGPHGLLVSMYQFNCHFILLYTPIL